MLMFACCSATTAPTRLLSDTWGGRSEWQQCGRADRLTRWLELQCLQSRSWISQGKFQRKRVVMLKNDKTEPFWRILMHLWFTLYLVCQTAVVFCSCGRSARIQKVHTIKRHQYLPHQYTPARPAHPNGMSGWHVDVHGSCGQQKVLTTFLH